MPSEKQKAIVGVAREDVAQARRAFSGYRLGLERKLEVYRALQELGYASEDLEVPDFMLRKSTIQAVTDFQLAIGAKPTGFLTREQFQSLQSVSERPRLKVLKESDNAKTAFENLNLSCEAKRVLYRALYSLGHTTRRTAFPDFLSDENVIAGVAAFQNKIGASATGFLTKVQVRQLRINAGKSYLWEHRECTPDRMLFPMREWYAGGYSDSDKQEIFDILQKQGFLKGDRLSNSLSNSDNKKAVRSYQASIGAEETGYLTSRQADGVLHGWQPLTPKQKWIALEISHETKKKLYTALFDLGHVRGAVPIIDFTFNENLIRAVSSFQSLAGLPSTGYLTKSEVDRLLAHEIKFASLETSSAIAKWTNPVKAWRYEDYSTRELTLIYRALYNRGFFVNEGITTDLTHPDLVRYIRKYQTYVAANPTGYLTRKQIADLLADPGKPTPQEQRRTKRSGLLAANASKDLSPARNSWQKLGYSLDEKRKIYRALFHLGLAKSPEMITDFSYRINLIDVVRAYQKQNGFVPTGFLTSEQAVKLMSLKAPLLPSEQQEAFFQISGRSAVLRFFRDLGLQEYGINNPVSAIVKRIQARFGYTADGYVSSELFEKARTIPLQVVRGSRRPQTLYHDSEERPASKDWGLWKSRTEELCETSTYSIHEDGFTGSSSPAGVALRRRSDWKQNTANISVRLRNWKPDTIAEMRVNGRRYLIKEAFGRTLLVSKDGLRVGNYSRNYSNLISGMMRANGFEIKYETDFGTNVVVSFSALGLTKQLRALMNAC
ncbi:hypothetical protein [Roseibium sp. SCP14]|uniref:hypothetical protein n=1 Tax=Roseibium sp. SCP14 TaxID=3141375 RepID=UPI0033390EB8